MDSAICPYSAGCPLYAEITSQNVLNNLKALYCESDYGACARYQLRADGAPVSSTLLPTGKDLAEGTAIPRS